MVPLTWCFYDAGIRYECLSLFLAAYELAPFILSRRPVKISVFRSKARGNFRLAHFSKSTASFL